MDSDDTPDSWGPCFAFSLKVPASVNGGDPNSLVYVGFRAILVGWFGAVDLAQDVARRLVLRIARAPTGGGPLPRGPLPTDPSR